VYPNSYYTFIPFQIVATTLKYVWLIAVLLLVCGKKRVLTQCISFRVTQTVNDTVYFLFLTYVWMQNLILTVHAQNSDANALCMCITGLQTFLHTEMQVDFLVKQLLKLSSQTNTYVAEQVFIKLSTLKFNGDLVTVFALLFVYR